MDNPLTFPIVLQIIGILIIVAEILLPSGGLLTLLATAVIGYSLYSVFSTLSTATGLYFVMADLVIVPLVVIYGFKMLAKSPVTLRKELSSDQGVQVQNRDLEKYIGKQGVALSDLRPSGTALFDKQKLDVVTEGKYLDKKTPVEVISVTGNQVIVKKTSQKGDES